MPKKNTPQKDELLADLAALTAKLDALENNPAANKAGRKVKAAAEFITNEWPAEKPAEPTVPAAK